MSFNNTGKVWTIEGFAQYLNSIKAPSWAKAVCLHHTAAPSLNQRPDGFLAKHLENLKSYYSNQLGWKSGPHLFVDDDQVWGMTPLIETGVHASSFNRMSIGIEVLGDYDNEDPTKGRGLQCWQTTAAATKLLFDWLKLPINDKTLLFHRDDPKTTKTCPGGKINKNWVINLIKNATQPQITAPANASFVPLYPALKAKGYSDEEIKKSLKINSGKVYWREKWLEKAFYDKTAQTTLSSLEELNLIEKNQ
jgi:hypothetical protein